MYVSVRTLVVKTKIISYKYLDIFIIVNTAK